MTWSYTKLSMYEKCPAKVRYRYVEKIKEEKSPQAERGTQIHSQFEAAIVSGAPLAAGLSYYQGFIENAHRAGARAEARVGVDASWNLVNDPAAPVWGLGFLDAVVSKTPTIEVYDWKTGKVYEEDHFTQRKIYSALALALQPDASEVRVTHVYVDLGKNRHNTFHRDQIASIRSEIEAQVEKMEKDQIMAPNPNFGCRWCSYSKAKGGPCPF